MRRSRLDGKECVRGAGRFVEFLQPASVDGRKNVLELDVYGRPSGMTVTSAFTFIQHTQGVLNFEDANKRDPTNNPPATSNTHQTPACQVPSDSWKLKQGGRAHHINLCVRSRNSATAATSRIEVGVVPLDHYNTIQHHDRSSVTRSKCHRQFSQSEAFLTTA